MDVDQKTIITNIIRVPLLRNIFFSCLAIAVIFPMYSIQVVYPAFVDRLIQGTEEDAVFTARHLTRMIIPVGSTFTGGPLSRVMGENIEALIKDFHLEKLKIFLRSGKIIYSTNPDDIGNINDRRYFHDIIAKGKIYTHLVKKDSTSMEGRLVASDVVETYVPLMQNNRFSGAFEIYYDITEKKEKLARLLSHSSMILYGIAGSLLIGVMIILFQASKTMIERSAVLESLRQARSELENRVEERTADLAEANSQLKGQIEERKAVEATLRETGERLHVLSSHLLTAQERERKRIAYGLHDELGQSLTVLKLDLRSLKENLNDDQQVLKSNCENTLKFVDQIIENVRRLARHLSPSILEDLGLTAALTWLIRNFGQRSNMEVSLDLQNIDTLISRDSQIIIYRIFQEALTNIGRHAGADHVRAVIEKKEGWLNFCIEDNGSGFDIDRVKERSPLKKSLGLMAMDERAKMLGGNLEIDSKSGEGTRIRFTTPIFEGNRRP